MTRQSRHLSLLALTGAVIAVLAFVVYRGQLAIGIGLILTGLILALALLALGAERAGSSVSATRNGNLEPGQGKEASDTANRVKSEFLATMSHEIRTPMNAVLGMTDLLRLTDLTRKQLGYLQTVQSSGDMLLSLLDNILDYTRLEAGGIDFHEQEFDVSELLATVLQIMGYQAYSKGLELIADDLAVSRLRVCGDSDRLRQILVNLVSNAIKFSEEGEVVIEVTVEALAQDDITLRFSVSGL